MEEEVTFGAALCKERATSLWARCRASRPCGLAFGACAP